MEKLAALILFPKGGVAFRLSQRSFKLIVCSRRRSLSRNLCCLDLMEQLGGRKEMELKGLRFRGMCAGRRCSQQPRSSVLSSVLLFLLITPPPSSPPPSLPPPSPSDPPASTCRLIRRCRGLCRGSPPCRLCWARCPEPSTRPVCREASPCPVYPDCPVYPACLGACRSPGPPSCPRCPRPLGGSCRTAALSWTTSRPQVIPEEAPD